MANRTDPLVKSIHGTNPENLVPKIVRTKIYGMRFWKEHCFGLTAETLVDKAKELDHIGGTFGGNRKPTTFMCLVLKMLQIQPEKAIVLEFIKNELFKYVRVLGAFYMRLTGADIDVYQYLEPLYNDCRKLRRKLADGSFALTHVDEVVEELLTSDYWCDINLPRIKKRETMERLGLLKPRKSALNLKDEDFEEEVLNENDQIRSLRVSRRRRSRSRERDEGRRRGPDRHLNDDRDRERNGSWGESGRNRDRNHHHHHRVRDEMDYDHHRRRRSHSRSPSQSRNHENHRDDEDDGTDHPDPEIAEANRLRASLGLKPLKV